MSKKPAPSKSRGEWKELLMAQGRSGLSQAEYCRVQGIDPRLFSLKKKVLEGQAEDGKFVEVSSKTSSGWEAEVEFPQGIRVRVRGA